MTTTHLANATNFWDSIISIKIIERNLKHVSFSNSVYVTVEIRLFLFESLYIAQTNWLLKIYTLVES